MASSRIFIKGLPPTFSEPEFKKHFSQKREITDAKIFPNRRIGYVGYRTPEDAQKAVKYFNKTFIRMSRIGVEIARPIQDRSETNGSSAPTARRASSGHGEAGQENTLKRKRPSATEEEQDPKLKEFLEAYKPKSKRKPWENEELGEAASTQTVEGGDANVAVVDAQSDEEYETVPKKTKRAKRESSSTQAQAQAEQGAVELPQQPSEANVEELESVDSAAEAMQTDQPAVSDADWTRSRTSRLLGLLDDDEEEVTAANHDEDATASEVDDSEPEKGTSKDRQATEAESSMPTPPSEIAGDDNATPAVDNEISAVRSSMRLFVRNLPYDVKGADLEIEFAAFGNLEEVHVPLDTKTGAAKGFAYIQFSDADAAEIAMQEKDGQTFQGRLLHILPAKKKRETMLDDFELSKLPLKKQQQIKRRREAASTTFNWNALYMNADAVVSSVADRLGLSKSEVLDPTSSDAAIKQAHAETHIIQETKAYFKQQGVDLDAFKKSQRGDTAILVKNIPYDCSKDELRRLFEEHGELKKFLMPPSATLAIVEFANAAQCKTAFGALAYRKIKSSVLFLEKAPKSLVVAKPEPAQDSGVSNGVAKTSASDLKDSDYAVPDTAGTATLFVRNLNFSTTTPELTETFKPLDGFMSARVKTKTDPKKPGQVLSMGFGFLEFRTSQQAQAALKAMDGYTLDGHKLQIRASHKGADAAEERRKADADKRAAGKRTKVVIKNLPFEATKKDVRALFGAYGQLRSVRVPKKMDRAARGFAFADFTTPKEAESAMDALKDTHLLGRRLVLDFADAEPEDAEAEIEKMQAKVGAQVNKVALQKLTSGGRKKFTTQNEDEEG
ncbi:Multiple RNA-binding domain-containing protein 1 [Vermiconidia calcicola]|uniref:Multiple RNA-binding domain-containing protein 1 n=1 Tax=Vermiconidia calcicola TaxID=1690605 RepID=A0ACC3N5N4_9PEZI|nr:Multiple RNA-binding domain-containing protein 1 [Vermiconidia calcicola]